MTGLRFEGLYGLSRSLLGIALGFYFRRIERFHPERVPATGPVLFTSNHPNSLTDSFIIGAAVPRKVHFVATVQLFRFTPLKWFLTRCGVIPINRVKDDPRSMRTVADTFEACFRVLEAGQAVGIFPEGITYNDDQLKEVKSGAARMALELEHRHSGKLGLKIVPVGLTYSAKELYRSDALAHFGQPIITTDFLPGYTEHRKECIARLTAEIESRLRSLILHLPQLEHARLLEGIKRLYLDHLLVGNTVIQEPLAPAAERLVLTQRIVEVMEQVYTNDPVRAERFAAKLALYERGLTRLQLADNQMQGWTSAKTLHLRTAAEVLAAVFGAPFALYGWIHRLLPYAIVRWAVRRFAEPGKLKAQASTAAIAAGMVAFSLCYGLYIFVFYRLFGWPASFWYALSLPPASLLAHYYLREVRDLFARVRNRIVLLRVPSAARRLSDLRAELVSEIDKVRAELSAQKG